MSYRIDRGRRLVEVVGTGDLTGEEITAIQAEMAADPEFDPTFAALVDFGAANFSAVPPSTARDHAEQHPFDPASPVACWSPAITTAGWFACSRALPS